MLSSSFIRFPVNRYPTADKAAWVEWRKSALSLLHCSSASVLSSFFGHHYSSFQATITELKTENPARNIFTQKSMLHGASTEQRAKNDYLSIDTEVVVIDNGEESKIHGYLRVNEPQVPPVFIMTTPDMIVKRGKCKEIVEFKCPYYEIHTKKLRNNRTIRQIALDFCEKYPMGKESPFLQAATYALTEPDIVLANVVYYFTDGTDDAALIMYTYDLSQVYEFDRMVLDAAARISHELQKDVVECRTSSGDKKKLTTAMCNAFYSVLTFVKNEQNDWVHLEEESHDDSETDGPEIPGE